MSNDRTCDECGDEADMYEAMYCLCFKCFDSNFYDEDDWFECNAEQPDS